MVAWRYKISLLLLKNIYLIHCAHSGDISSTLNEKLRISTWPCNILYIFTCLVMSITDDAARQDNMFKVVMVKRHAG